MPRHRYVFDPPERFVAGTVGEPGSRTFFIQARDGNRVVSIVLEKVQVAVLADRLGKLLDELERRGIAEAASAEPQPDSGPLDEPLVEAFRAGVLALGWDGSGERILVEAREQTEEDAEEAESDTAREGEGISLLDDDAEDGPDYLQVRLTPLAARAFVDRAVRVVASGRPPCPLCGAPLDPTGHLCPRRNGNFLN
jgi:uncharacterized repeat protein (TIGR03847 family)